MCNFVECEVELFGSSFSLFSSVLLPKNLEDDCLIGERVDQI